MKNNKRFVVAAVLASLMCFAGSPAQALTKKETADITRSIKDAPGAELALKATEAVTKASKKEKEATAVVVVRAAIARNPAAAVTVVSSVIKAAPSTAPAVAAAAAKAAPDQIEAIASAAALAAPDLADKVVAALIDENPKAAERVAKAVAFAVPQAQASVQQVVRQRSNGSSAADQFGGQYSSSSTRIDGSSFPSTPPQPANYASGSDPSRP
ncbi:MAG TPA: hypothetical protein VFF11_03725 [Candidatus Binatia bacterium]|nr:hypothetical protein [Candidatus Binatia bacterium]